MKWMISSAVIVAVSLSVGVRAQSGGAMAQDEKMGKMETPTKAYTGCVVAGADASLFTLTHVMADDHIGKVTMKKDAMASTTMTLSSRSVDLGKHIGHRVTVTGSSGPDKMDAMGKNTSAFTVKSLKMVSASCS